MSFVRPIDQNWQYGLEVAEVWVPLVVLDDTGPSLPHDFIFDTGCAATMVSEDVARTLGLPPDDGTRRVRSVGSTGRGCGRLVDVRFRFPVTVSGAPGLEVSSTWVVVTGRADLALLGFQEVHRHFRIRTYEFDMYFMRR